MNPFNFSGPVDSVDVIDREHELDRLLRTAESGNNSRLQAPREYGKTSLLSKLQRNAQLQGWTTVYVDFFGILTLADATARVERAYAEQLTGDLARWFEGIRSHFPRFHLGAGGAGVEIDLDPQAEQPLLARLRMPQRLLEKHGLRTLVVFDEFQDVLTARDDADEILRSEIQHHRDAASYVFAGSDLGMMRQLFGERRRAFYRQADLVGLEPLPDDALASFIVERTAATGKSIDSQALRALLDRVQGHPRAAMLLAHRLWDLTAPGEEADLELFDEAEAAALAQSSADLHPLWTRLGKPERGLILAIARGERPFSRNRSDGGGRGANAQTALTKLLDSGEIIEREGAYRITDPLFAELVRRDWSP